MDQLKLKYIIELVSDIGAKSMSDAKKLDKAQEVVQKALKKTNGEVGGVERALLRMGDMGSASAARQAQYLGRLALQYDAYRRSVDRAVTSTTKFVKAGAGVAVGGAAAVYTANAMLKKPLDYDTRLRGITQTVYGGADVAGLRKGMVELNEFITGVVRKTPGASRDQTLDAYGKIVGGGAFTTAEGRDLLPGVMRASVAHSADAVDLVKAGEKMKQSLGLTAQEVEIALAKVARAGQVGGFEIKDSAKSLGPLLPFMKGYKGMDAVDQLVTMLQQARVTAGSEDEAANNLRNFLQKMGADSTRKDFAKYGIDLDATMAKGAAQGQSPVTTYMAALERLMAQADPAGKARAAMKHADSAATPEERAARYEQIKTLYEDSAVSRIINDLQEFGGYSALRKSAAYGQDVLAKVRAEKGVTTDTGFEFMAEGSGAKMTAAENAKDIAASDALTKIAPALNSMLDGVSGAAAKYPELTSTLVLATGALGVFTAALTASSLASVLTGGGKGGGAVAGLLGRVAGLFGVGAAVGGATGAGAGLAAAMPALAALGGAWGLYQVGRLGMAYNQSETDLENLAAQDRVTLSAESLARLNNSARPNNWRGRGYRDPRLLGMTGPAAGVGSAAEAIGAVDRAALGEGVLRIEVSAKDGSTATIQSVRSMPGMKISAGNTNPAGY